MPTAHRSVKRHPGRSRTNLIDVLAYTLGPIGPLFTIPQIIAVWQGNTEGVSLLSWFSFMVFNAFWALYATYHKDKPLIVLHTLWVIMQGVIVAGLILK
jgi:uncharacterized protein with PQ loop repeat